MHIVYHVFYKSVWTVVVSVIDVHHNFQQFFTYSM